MKPMPPNFKKVIAIVLAAGVALVAWYGSYLPMRKAQTFITTLEGLQTNPPSSLQQLETTLAIPLDYPSPIGQEELVRNTANSVLAYVQHSTDATTTADLIGFLNQYYDPILARGKGMSFGQDLYLEGAINETAFVATGDSTYLMAAQKWYKEGEADGPNRPQPLYGLFDIYRFENNVTSTTAIADKILANWPTDTSTKQALGQFLAGQGISTTTRQ